MRRPARKAAATAKEAAEKRTEFSDQQMIEILDLATSVSSPLALGGLLAALFFFFLKSLIDKGLFTTLSEQGTSKILSKSINYLFYLALTGCILGTTTYLVPVVYQQQPPTVSEERKRELTIVSLKKEIIDLRGSHYETIDLYGSFACDDVKNSASKLGKLILETPTTGIRGSYLVMKFQYAAFAYMMAADTATSGPGRVNLANKSISAALESLSTIDNLKNKGQQGDTRAWKSYEWTINDNGHNRTLWILAKAYAIKAYETGEDIEKVSSTISMIDQAYLTRWNPESEKDIAWSITGGKKNRPERRCS